MFHNEGDKFRTDPVISRPYQGSDFLPLAAAVAALNGLESSGDIGFDRNNDVCDVEVLLVVVDNIDAFDGCLISNKHNNNKDREYLRAAAS